MENLTKVTIQFIWQRLFQDIIRRTALDDKNKKTKTTLYKDRKKVKNINIFCFIFVFVESYLSFCHLQQFIFINEKQFSV